MTRHAHTGTKLRKVMKGDYVRVVEDNFRRASEKEDKGKAHLDYGIRWEKGIYKVEKVTRGSVWIKKNTLIPIRFRRVHVQLVPRESVARKKYEDRPKLDDSHDPERKERTGAVQKDQTADEKYMVKKMERKI